MIRYVVRINIISYEFIYNFVKEIYFYGAYDLYSFWIDNKYNISFVTDDKDVEEVFIKLDSLVATVNPPYSFDLDEILPDIYKGIIGDGFYDVQVVGEIDYSINNEAAEEAKEYYEEEYYEE